MTASPAYTPMRRATCLGAVAVALAGCSADPVDPDTLELATIRQDHKIPKSTPAQLLAGFDKFCVNGPTTMAAKGRALRDAGYVPTPTSDGEARELYLIDNRQPAIAISERMCIARATARTGQRNAVTRYIAATFPEATPTGTDQFSVDVEEAWAIEGGLIATARNRWRGNRSSYSVIHFTAAPGVAPEG